MFKCVQCLHFRRAEREQLAELERINEKRNKVIDLNDLIKSKLEKNKRYVPLFFYEYDIAINY